MAEREPFLPFDLRSLEIFLAVCNSGSMAAAARSLGMTQPAVSLSVAELERKTGTSLFDRAVRPLALTPAGGLMRQRAGALIADALQIGPLLRDTRYGRLPLIRVGLVDSLTRALTVPIGRILSARADEVSILSGLTAMHASELLTRRLDLLLGVDDLEDLPGLERWELAREPYVLLLRRGAGAVRSVADLKRLATTTPLVRFSARSRTGVEIDRHLRRLGVDVPRSLECDTPYAVAAMVAAGEGFAVTTALCMAESMLPAKSVSTVKLPGPQITRKLTMVARQRELGQIPRELASIARRALTELGIEDLRVAS